MKSKEELKKQWDDERAQFIADQNNEIIRFEESVDFDKIYGDIEELLEENYVQHGRMECQINLSKWMPDFNNEVVSETDLWYHARNIVIKELEDKGFDIGIHGTSLSIS